MCTLSWFINDTGYELFFNRDERNSRSRAQLPSKHQYSGVHYISPTDTDAGGTWIACNHFGVTVCLLNYYQFEQTEIENDWISRGKIVRLLATAQNIINAELSIRKIDLSRYQAFRLFAIAPDGENRLFIWNGKQLKIENNVKGPKSSSSVNTQHVKKNRYQLFDDLNLKTSTSTEAFLAYHASHKPKQSEKSVCMHREDACTVSMSHIQVTADSANFAYIDGAPCNNRFQEPMCLALVTSSS